MAQISFTDDTGAAVLRSAWPSPADRFQGWVPMTRPVTSSSTNLATGALCTYEFRRDYGASFSLPGIGYAPAQAPTNFHAAGNGSAGSGAFTNGQAYYFVVTAIVNGVESAASNESGTLIMVVNDSVSFTWDAVPGATAYKIYLGFAAGSEYEWKNVGNVTSYTDTTAAGYTAGTPPTGDNINWVSIADRLVAHLLTGGTCAVACEDTPSSTYATCGLYPGSTPTLTMTDSRTLEHTLSLSLLNLAGSPVQMVCVYAP